MSSLASVANLLVIGEVMLHDVRAQVKRSFAVSALVTWNVCSLSTLELDAFSRNHSVRSLCHIEKLLVCPLVKSPSTAQPLRYPTQVPDRRKPSSDSFFQLFASSLDIQDPPTHRDSRHYEKKKSHLYYALSKFLIYKSVRKIKWQSFSAITFICFLVSNKYLAQKQRSDSYQLIYTIYFMQNMDLSLIG